jgi:1,2-diacylglycerol 3-alpha-glucosyltransferase
VRGLIGAEPDSVVLMSDRYLARDLHAWRERSGAKFSLVLCNGGGDGPPFDFADRVLQPRPGLLEEALGAGEPADRHVLLPLGAQIDEEYTGLSADEVSALRVSLGLPADRQVVLSVAALTLQKRLDYVIREVASMALPRPFLMLLGQRQGDTKAIQGLAEELLGPDGYAMRTVTPGEVPDYYRAADAFVFAPLHEGLGLVLVEALSHGLPCVAHDWDGARFALGEHGAVADLRPAGALGGLLEGALAEQADPSLREARHRDAYERFSWDRLADRYVDVLGECAPARSMEPAVA